MSSIWPASAATPRLGTTLKTLWPWAPIIAGLVALYGPTLYDLNRTLWNQEEHAHGPLIVLVVAWLCWSKRQELAAVEKKPATVAGGILIAFGLLLYIVGRSQAVIMFEVGSLIPVLAGLVLFCRGARALRTLAFPLFFILFMIPLPGAVIDNVTGPLKQYVSVIAENVLYVAGYPIARMGVVLSIGQYQLLVADACSGLNSMFSLSAVGLLYLYLMKYPGVWRNGILLAAMLPIAFVANICRVLVLILITYYFGDAAGQGFLHGFAGIALFVIALTLLFSLDSLLGATIFAKGRK